MSLMTLSLPLMGVTVNENCCNDNAQRIRRAFFVLFARKKDKGLWSTIKINGRMSKYLAKV